MLLSGVRDKRKTYMDEPGDGGDGDGDGEGDGEGYPGGI